MSIILHIAKRSDWENAKREGTYAAASLASEGFIHCSTVAQTVETANRFYRGQPDLVLLVINEGLVKAEVRYESPADTRADSADGFPHIYGRLNVDAVTSEYDFVPGANGAFVLPSALSDL